MFKTNNEHRHHSNDKKKNDPINNKKKTTGTIRQQQQQPLPLLQKARSGKKNAKTTATTTTNKKKTRPNQHALVVLRVFILSIGMSLVFLCRFENIGQDFLHTTTSTAATSTSSSSSSSPAAAAAAAGERTNTDRLEEDDMPSRRRYNHQPQDNTALRDGTTSTARETTSRHGASSLSSFITTDAATTTATIADKTTAITAKERATAPTQSPGQMESTAAATEPLELASILRADTIKLPEKRAAEAPRGNHPVQEQQNTSITTTTHSSSTTQDAPFVIFYNIWIARMGEKYKNTLRIVEEQLQQVGTSYAATQSAKTNKKNNVTLYYQTIGKPNTVTPQFMNPLCQQYGMDCIHLGHRIKGFEEITLQALYDFCQKTTSTSTTTTTTRQLKSLSVTNMDYKVIYLHTKGAFHNRRDGSNDRWRRHLTMAATSQHCVSNQYQQQQKQQHQMTTTNSMNATSSDKTCNLCGLLFYPVWTPFVIGNMWSAQCSYIQKLVPPKHFAQRMNDLVQYNLTNLQNRNLMHVNLYKHEPWFLGLERYAAELWVGTHPDVRPCDVSVTADNEYWTAKHPKQQRQTPSKQLVENEKSDKDKSQNAVLDEFVWSMAPRSYPSNATTTTFMTTQSSRDANGTALSHATTNTTNSNLDAPWLRLDPDQRVLVLSNQTLRMREFFLLPGLILKWHVLYNGTYPPPSSWVWDFYPDGAHWREQLAKHGVAAVLQEPD